MGQLAHAQACSFAPDGTISTDPLLPLPKYGNLRPELRKAMLRVLIADNRHAAAECMAETLANYGYHATTVYSGQKAVELAALLRPDVLISEVIMPGMTGIEAAILIRLMLPSCRVILYAEPGLTGELFERAKSQGHQFETLEKPVEPKALLAYLAAAGSSTAPSRGWRQNRS